MGLKRSNPFCKDKRQRCYFRVPHGCGCLTDTDFGEKGCPFYATETQVVASRVRTNKRLRDMGLTHLIRDYIDDGRKKKK